MKNTAIAIGIGFFLGLLAAFSAGSVFCLFLVFLIILEIRSNPDRNEAEFLTRLFISGIAIRIILLLLIQFILISRNEWMYLGIDKTATLFGDAGMNTIVGSWYAQYAAGEPLEDFPLRVVLTGSLGDYGRSGYLYFVSLFYFLFGRSPISVTFINCILSVLTGILYYSIAKHISEVKTAKFAAILITFFPSLIIWSVSNMKDSLIIFLIGATLWLALRLFRNFKAGSGYLILLILSLALQWTLRDWVFLPSLLVIGLCYLYPRIKKRIKFIHISLVILLLVPILLINASFFKAKVDTFKSKMVDYQRGVVSSGGQTYRLYDDWVYSPRSISGQVSYLGFLKGFLKGWFYNLLEPFPWKIYSMASLASFPQMVIWYFLLPLSVLGILVQLRYSWNMGSLVMVAYFLTIGSILALTGGNIGTIFRMRDMLTPIILMFSSKGIFRLFYQREKT